MLPWPWSPFTSSDARLVDLIASKTALPCAPSIKNPLAGVRGIASVRGNSIESQDVVIPFEDCSVNLKELEHLVNNGGISKPDVEGSTRGSKRGYR